MKITLPIMGLTLLTLSGAASAWQPVVYPIRSQSPWQQNADAATCYGMASRQTNVNITRQAQSAMPPKLASGAPGIGGGGVVSQPPLPASGTSLASASATTTGASPATGMPATAMPASGAPATTAQASEPMPRTDKNGVPQLGGASDPQTAAEVKPPPMPPPEPPMTRYWRAYAGCMQGKGYAVQ